MMGRITKKLHITCPLVQDIRKRVSEFPNVIIQRVGNPFAEDLFKHYKKNNNCVPNVFLQISMNLLQKAYIIMLIFAGIKKLSLTRNGLNVVLSLFGSFFAQIGTSPARSLTLNFQMPIQIFCDMKV